jgi:hypothetical protein
MAAHPQGIDRSGLELRRFSSIARCQNTDPYVSGRPGHRVPPPVPACWQTQPPVTVEVQAISVSQNRLFEARTMPLFLAWTNQPQALGRS